MSNTEEIWKDVVGYEGIYQVSNLGRVKSLNYNHTGKEKVRKLDLGRKGYYLVVLCKGGKRKAHIVHRLVMLAFIGESDLQVNHKNGIKTDNRLENLEYCTASENIRHSFDTGLKSGQK